MFFPEGHIRVFLYGVPTDMRKSFDGLYALARHGLQQDPLNGQLFVFISRRATQMRVLYWDRSGWCLWSKRLEAGRFIRDWREVQHREMDWTALKLMIEGIEVKRQFKRYRINRENRRSGNSVNSHSAMSSASIASTHVDREARTSSHPGSECR